MKRNLSAIALAGVSLACVVYLAACNCAPILRYVTVSPASATINAGTTEQYAASLYYSDGSIKDGTGQVQWTSSNTSVAVIGPGGLATGVGGGTTTITATAGGIAPATATLTVNAFTSITVTPSNPSIGAGMTQQFTATGMPGSIDVTNQVAWSSGTTSVATISSGGLATGLTAGTSLITAALPGVSGSTTLTVTGAVPVALVVTPSSQTIAVGNELTYLAQEQYSDGTLHMPAHPVTWGVSSANPANSVEIVTDPNSIPKNNENGLAVGLAAGTASIAASEGSFAVITSITVVTGKAHYAYVANGGGGIVGGDNVTWFAVDVTSATPFTSPQTAAAGAPAQIVLHPSNNYLYNISTGSDVYVSDMGANGVPNSSGIGPAPAGSGNFNYMAVDPYGRFLYVTDSGTTTIYGFTISSTDGSLTLMTGAPFNFATLNSPQCIVIDPTGKYLYVTNGNGNTVSGFSINQTTGVLTALPTATAATGSTPQFEALDPSGKHLYVANSGDNTITMIPIGAGGAMGTPVTTSAISGASSISNVVVDPSGTHLYALDAGSGGAGQVYAFNINSADGSVGSAIGTAQPTGDFPFFNMAIDPTGALLATANNFDSPGTISLFSIGSGGALTPKTPATVGSGGEAPEFVIFLNAP
ncbi:MAG TPA: beta-propeller fold lactonase family protein [Candidatus Limnocylindrales bacterium]|nr:beta-propeller fold lactonase family protein [Candidatus Limnocylindrales bacterium]